MWWKYTIEHKDVYIQNPWLKSISRRITVQCSYSPSFFTRLVVFCLITSWKANPLGVIPASLQIFSVYVWTLCTALHFGIWNLAYKWKSIHYLRLTDRAHQPHLHVAVGSGAVGSTSDWCNEWLNGRHRQVNTWDGAQRTWLFPIIPSGFQCHQPSVVQQENNKAWNIRELSLWLTLVSKHSFTNGLFSLITPS